MRSLRSLKLPLFVAAIVAVAAVLVYAVTTQPSSPATSDPVAEATRADDGRDPAGDPAHRQPASMRMLAVYTDAEPAPSAHPERMRALLTEGTLPSGVVTATVLTDEDCAPDEQGTSHCRNQLRLPNGRKLTVRHPHRMHEVPCMTPGETVRLSRAADA